MTILVFNAAEFGRYEATTEWRVGLVGETACRNLQKTQHCKYATQTKETQDECFFFMLIKRCPRTWRLVVRVDTICDFGRFELN